MSWKSHGILCQRDLNHHYFEFLNFLYAIFVAALPFETVTIRILIVLS